MSSSQTPERWFPLETHRLFLREFVPSDEEDVHAYGADPMVSRYEDWGPNSLEETHAYLLRCLDEQRQWPRNEVNLAVELKHERKVIGSVRLSLADPADEAATLGYAFNRSYWNTGYATEAAGAVLTNAFAHLKLKRISATCDTRNVGSWRVMEKLGMRREGHFLHDKLQRGEWRDSYLYAILAGEWLSPSTGIS